MLIMNESFDDAAHKDPGHPERPERLHAVRAGVDDLDLGDDLRFAPVHVATRSQLTRVHDGTYLDELGAFCYSGGGDIDEDTYATYDTWSIAQRAAGAGLSVINELNRLNDGVGLIAVRPPGHHASRDRAMGFCLLNNIAISAAALVDQGERVLIIDWDVHHGNGTQSIFWNEPHVLYVSTHQWPLFPGSGAACEIGGLDAPGRVVNLPLRAGTTGDVVQRALEEVAAPVIDAFDPTWVLVSAGFDAHRDDPLADLALSGGDFAALSALVRTYAPRNGRLAFFLEGGYNLAALRTSIAASLGAVLGSPFRCEERPTNGAVGIDEIACIESERAVALRDAEQQAS